MTEIEKRLLDLANLQFTAPWSHWKDRKPITIDSRVNSKMSQPLVTILTYTYNKPTLFAECAASVLAQSFTDWVWWVVFNATSWPGGYLYETAMKAPDWFHDPRVMPIWYPVSDEIRKRRYIPATIPNWLYPKVMTPYIYFLADDDLIDPDGLGVLVSALNTVNKTTSCGPTTDWLTRDAVYGRCEVTSEQPDGTFKHAAWLHPGPNAEFAGPFTLGAFDIGLGTGINPDCLIDGGQVLHTKALWDRATADGWGLDDNPAEEHAGHADGTLLNRLAKFARFHYVPTKIVTHRRTKLSTWLKPL